MDKLFYTVYLYKFSQEDILEIRNRTEKLKKQLQSMIDVQIRKISDESIQDKLKIVNAVILAERSRYYQQGKTASMYLRMIEYAKDKFLGILSVHENSCQDNDLKLVFKEMFNANTYSYFEFGNDSAESKKFWEKNAYSYYIAGKKDYTVKYKMDTRETYPLVVENEKAFLKLLNEYPQKTKALVSAATAKIMCEINDTRGIVFEDVHQGGRLTRIPVWFDNNCNIKIGQQKLYELFSNADRNDTITYEEITNICNMNFQDVTMYSQGFFAENSYVEMFKRMKVSELYKIGAIEVYDSAMYVGFLMHEDNRVIEFDYDSGFFKDVNMQGFADAIGKLVDSALEGNCSEINVKELVVKENDNARKVFNYEVDFMKKMPLFDSFKESEIARIAKKGHLSCLYCQQDILSKGNLADGLYIILKGNVIIEGRNMDGYVCPISILDEGEVFGIEGLLEDSKVNFNYVVESSQCYILKLDKEMILEEAGSHPAFYQRIIEIQTKRLNKFQRLFVLS